MDEVQQLEIPDEPAEETLEIDLAVPESLRQGNYSNFANVRHTAEEFVLDFVMVIPPEAQLVSRVLLNPSHLKRLHDAIGRNIEKYENKFGEIQKEKPSETNSKAAD